MWSVLHVACVDVLAQVSLIRWSIIFLDVPTLKLTVIIIILPTDRLEIILPTAVQQKTKLLSTYIKHIVYNFSSYLLFADKYKALSFGHSGQHTFPPPTKNGIKSQLPLLSVSPREMRKKISPLFSSFPPSPRFWN